MLQHLEMSWKTKINKRVDTGDVWIRAVISRGAIGAISNVCGPGFIAECSSRALLWGLTTWINA